MQYEVKIKVPTHENEQGQTEHPRFPTGNAGAVKHNMSRRTLAADRPLRLNLRAQGENNLLARIIFDLVWMGLAMGCVDESFFQ